MQFRRQSYRSRIYSRLACAYRSVSLVRVGCLGTSLLPGWSAPPSLISGEKHND